jgi:purine-nucleoside phosphorylase
MDYYSRVQHAADCLRDRGAGTPAIGVVLGSGLGAFADRLTDPLVVSYADIPNWPAATVVGHAGRLVVGTLAGRRIAALSGRAHYYEGYDMGAVTFAPTSSRMRPAESTLISVPARS